MMPRKWLVQPEKLLLLKKVRSWMRIHNSECRGKSSVVDPDLRSFGCPGSGSELGMRIRDQNLHICLVFCLSKRLLYLCRYAFGPITYLKYIFHVKILLFVTLKSDQDPDPGPHWFGSLDPDHPADPQHS
jgi:hypothetical protein